MKHNQGFTLIELMIAVAIVAILAAIGYASYTRYIVRNAEAQAEAKMQSLAMELDRFRSSRLTYKGFRPKKVNVNKTEEYRFEDGTEENGKGKQVYSNDSNNRYVISVTDANGNEMKVAEGGQWVLFAEPADTAIKQIKYKYFMSSTGQRCRSNGSFAFDGKNSQTICAGAGVESW